MRNRFTPSGWLRRTIGLLALLIALVNAGLAAAQTASTDPAAGKHFTKEPVFHLPISIQEKMRSSIREVQLWVKTPGGEWQRKDTQPPTQKAFTYRAPNDGEYWFTLVTVDNKGGAMPSDLSKLQPDEIVMVIVDTQPPVFDLQPMKVASGDLLVRCVVNDANPDLSAIKVSYHGGDQAMRTLEQLPGMPGMFRASGPEIFASPLHVTVTDLAGNTTTRDVNLRDAVAKLYPAPQPVMPITPVNPMSSPAVVQTNEASAVMTGPGGLQGGMLPPPTLPSNVQSIEARSMQVADPRAMQIPAVQPALIQSPAAQPAAAAASAILTGSTPRQFINTTRASLDYKIDQVGPSGVAKVEVYLTTDQGASWKRFCEDADRRSPAEFDLPGDGLYGVRVVLTNGNGFGGRPPVPGEQPQLWIEVDTAPPTVQLRDVQPSTYGGIIDLHWVATDKNLGQEPISLYYATRHEGPWLPVARGLKNDGIYHWQFPRDMGAQFFVRIEAQDMAGNVAHSESSTAVVLDMTEPRASVLGVNAVQNVLTPVRGGN